MKMTSTEIRTRFLEYFARQGHLIIPSSSLIPANDPTLLVVNSGMAPLKPYFTGEKKPPHQRLCNVQKCVRTNDIDIVGDRHHMTFFEMMGNWSIGDYFKKEAILLAWKMIKEAFSFDTSQMYVTVYAGDKRFPNVPPDEESKRIWEELISSDRIVLLGADSNFWGPAGETGPCGPCTEIFIDRGERFGCGKPACGPDCSCGRFLEIWNGGVFMQYYLHEDKTLTELPLKSVDAGAGLERFSVILQGVDSVYEIDLVYPLSDLFRSLSQRANPRSIRTMTDHIRCAVFMISDGIYPANTKREYVLRRIIRRMLLHASITGFNPSNFRQAVEIVVDLLSPHYPEIRTSQNTVKTVIKNETVIFDKVLRRGSREFEKIASKSGGIISGAEAFRLHDTLGFPLDLTKELAQARGISVDETGFQTCLEEQKARSRQAGKHSS